MKAKIHRGHLYQVCEGSGIDSRRIGLMVDYRRFSQSWIQANEPGRYKPFNPKIEALLLDEYKNQYFTMFKNRLIPVDGYTDKLL
jgi:hypothetical protein